MRLARYCLNGRTGLLMLEGTRAYGLCTDEEGFPGDVADLVGSGGDALLRAGKALRQQRTIAVNPKQSSFFLTSNQAAATRPG